jgi:hypothetical protein
MLYADIVICVGPLTILETWPPIYRGQERTERGRLRVSQSSPHVYFQYTPCLTDFTFEFIRRPTSPILSPSSRTFVELTLVTFPLFSPLYIGENGSRLPRANVSKLSVVFDLRSMLQKHEVGRTLAKGSQSGFDVDEENN